jgi:Lysophospholipase L1 and related esterases
MSGDGLSLWHRIARPVGLGLGPLLLAQGRWARSNGPRLPNAPKPWSGTISGREPLYLLGLGDSTIAGVGVDNPMNGLTAQFAKELYRYTGRGLTWDSIGQRGITAEELLEDYLPEIDQTEPPDVVLVSIGANDAKNMVSPRRAATAIDIVVDRLPTDFPRHHHRLVTPAFHSFEPPSALAQSCCMGSIEGECGLNRTASYA